MNPFKKYIFTDFAPNVEWDDVVVSLRVLLMPWTWRTGSHKTQIEKRFADMHHTTYAQSFVSGRAALQTALAALHLPPESEVLVQAYTCVAVPDAVRFAGLKPVYVDINESTYNMSVDSARANITPHTKAIVVQHTFGLPADMEEILALAREHNLAVIEDCAHALGSTYHDRLVGSFGDAAIFSFGRNKVISSVFGGMLITNRKDIYDYAYLQQRAYPQAGRIWIVKQLLYAPLMRVARATYSFFGFGKALMRVALSVGLIVRAVQPLNARQSRSDLLRRQFPNALAILALHQLAKLSRGMEHRQHIAALYRKELHMADVIHPLEYTDRVQGYVRYTLRAPRTDVARIMKEAKELGVVLGDWYQTPIAPSGVDMSEISYRVALTPTAQAVASHTFNLPTDVHITDTQARRIMRVVHSGSMHTA